MLATLALTLFLHGSLQAQATDVGSQAPEFTAKEWFNTVGSAPTLKSLRGQAVLIEFWATW
jgi:hypothetical protein